MTDLSTLLTIETEHGLHRWLAAQRVTQSAGSKTPNPTSSPSDLDGGFQTGGASCLNLMRQWDAGYRYMAVAFRGGMICFSSLPACARELGVVVAVEIADRYRFDLAVGCRGYF